MRKKLIAILIVCCLVAPILFQNPLETEAATDQYGFNTETPSDFHANDGANPYGNGYTAINPIMEPFVFRSADESMNVSYWNDVKPSEGNGLSSGKQVTIESRNSECAADFVVSKAYDPAGSGHDYMVAMVGLQRDEIIVWSYNTRTKQKSSDFVLEKFSGNDLDWFDKIEQWEYTSFFNLTAGDFDGDGTDEIAVYVPKRGKPYVKILDANTNGTFSEITGQEKIYYDTFMEGANVSSEFTNDGRIERAMVQGSLEAADLDRDGKDELVVLGSFADLHDDSNTKSIKDRSSSLAIFKLSGDKMTQWGDSFKMNNGVTYLRTASCAAGDIDYNGFPEIVVAGYYTTSATSDDLNGENFAMTTLAYNTKTGKMSMGPVSTVDMNNFVDDGLYTGDTVQAPPALTCVAIDGRNSKEGVFLEGNMFFYDTSEFVYDHVYSKYQSSDDGIDGYIISNTWMETAVAGNFDGNALGIEQVYYTTGYKQMATDDCFYVLNVMGKGTKTTGSGDNEITEPGDYYDKHWQYVHYHEDSDDHLFVSLAAVDADDDTDTMKYSSKEYTYTNVNVLAVLQAAPYFEDLKDSYPDNTGATTFGKTTGSGESTSSTKSAEAGVFLSAEIPLGLVAKLTTEAAYTHEWQWEYEEETTIEYGIQFEGGFMEDSVVLYRTPVTLYYYDVYPAGGGSSYKMTVGIQDDPIYSVMELNEYNTLAQNDDSMKDKVISDNVLSSTPGQPSTYNSSAAGLQDFTGAANFNSSVSGATTAATTQSITTGSQSSSSQTYNNSFELKVGVKGDVLVAEAGGGVSAGGGWGGGTTTFEYKDVEKSGTVANPPSSEYPYSFRWKFGTWRANIGGTDVPVLGYLVDHVVEPPSLPQNVAVDTVTEDSITISWDHGVRRPVNYEIYQYFEDSVADSGYSLIATLDGSEDTFTYKNLDPGNSYTLAIRSVGIDENGDRIASEYSPLVTGTTLRGGSSLTINSMTPDVSVCPGDTASFTVNATPSQGVDTGLTYSWQVREAGTTNWKNFRTGSSTLTLNNVTKDMDGNRYRCVVSEIQNGSRSYAYSEARLLTVNKADTATTVTALQNGKNTGNADYTVATTTEETQEVVKTITVTIGENTASYQEYKNTLDNPNPEFIYRSQEDNQYYVLKKLKLTGDGTYTADGRIPLARADAYFASKGDDDKLVPIENINPDELTGTEQKIHSYEVETEDEKGAEEEYLCWQAEKGSTSDGNYEALMLYTKKDSQEDKSYYQIVNGKMTPWTNKDNEYTITALYSSDPGKETIGEVEYQVWQMLNNPDLKVYQTTDGDGTVRYYQEVTVPDGDGTTTQMVEIYLIQSDNLTDEDETYTVKPADEAEKVEETQQSVTYTYKDGDAVTLTAEVDSESEGKSVSGQVTFQILNNQTGDVTTVSANVTENTTGKGTATATWTPKTAGDYTITATFSGNSMLNTSSGSATYYAVSGPQSDAGYVIESENSDIVYGDTIDLAVKETEVGEDGNVVLKDLAQGTAVSYHVEYMKDGVLEEKDIPDGSYIPEVPGTHSFTATVAESGKQATKSLNVQKRPITMTAPTKLEISGDAGEEKIPTVDGIKVQYTGYEPDEQTAILPGDRADFPYSDIVDISSTPELTESSGAGDYITALSYKTKEADEKGNISYTDSVQKFLARYDTTLQKGLYSIAAGVYYANYQAGANGSIYGYFGDNLSLYNSGTTVTEGTKLTFVAYPDENFQVEKWTVSAGGVALKEGEDYTINGNQLVVSAIRKNIEVKVSFTPSSYELAFSAGANGTITAQYMENGEVAETSLTSPEIVPAGKSIRLTAEPEKGYVVKQWNISKAGSESDTQKNEDGSVYSKNTLDIANMNSDVIVSVEFEKEEFYTVNTSVVADSGNPATGSSISVEGLTSDGMAKKGSEVTFKANLAPNSIVREWRVYNADDTSYEVVSGNTPSYVVSNVQNNLHIEILVSEQKKYPIHFEVLDEENKIVTGENIITASWSDVSLKSGDSYTAYIPVEFETNLPTQYQVASWSLKQGGSDGDGTTVAEGKDATTWTLNSLSNETWVTLHVEQRPTLTYSPTNTDVEGVNGEISCKELASGAYLDKYRTDNIELRITPDTGYEIDEITVKEGNTTATEVTNPSGSEETVTAGEETGGADVSGSAAITYTKSAIENSADTLLTVIPGSSGFKENVTVEVTFKPITPCVNVEYSLHNLGNGTHGKIAASVDRLGDEDYKVEDAKPVDNVATLENVYRDSVVTFKVTPDTGYVVAKWSVNGTEVTDKEDISTDKTANDTFVYTITSADKDSVKVVAQLEQISNKLTFGAESVLEGEVTGGTVTAFNNVTQEDFSSGNMLAIDSSITFTAEASEGYELVGWKVNNELVDNETANTFTTVVEAASLTNVKAVFDRVPYTVTWSAEGGTVEVKNTTEDDVAVTSGSQVRGGRSLTFTAKPDQGMEFKGWTVTGATVSDEDLNESPLTLTLESNVTVQAAFDKQDDYTVTFGSNNETMGTVTATAGLETQQAITSGDSVPSNHKVIFTATPKQGYLVEGWYSSEEEMNKENGTPIAGTQYEQTEYTLNALDANTTVYVKFAEIPSYDITIGQAGTGEGSLKVFLNDQEVALVDGKISAPRHSKVSVTATPEDEYNLLTAWNGQPSTSDTYTIEDVTEATSITATFTPAVLVPVQFNIPNDVDGDAAKVTAGSGDDYGSYQTVGAVGTEIGVIQGKNVRFEIDPPNDKMVDTWTVEYADGSVDPDAGAHGLDNVLMLENLEKGATVTVTLKPIQAYTVPEETTYDVDADGSSDYTISERHKIPDTLPKDGTEDYTDMVRENGDVTLKVIPAEGKWIKDIRLAEESSGDKVILRNSTRTEANVLTSVKNKDGSWDVTVANVTRDIELVVETGNYYTLTIDKAKNGSITARDSAGNDVASGGQIMEGDSITLTATPAKHYRLVSWGGDAAEAGTVSGNATEITLTNIEGDIRVSAEFAMTEHTNTEIRNAKDATCTEDGYTGDTYCKDCGIRIAKGEVIKALGHNYTSKVTEAATTQKAGVITYTCSRCGHTYTESIKALPKPIVAKPLKTGRNKIRLSWNKVSDADGYIIYADACNTRSKKKEKTVKKVKTVVSGNRTTWTHKKLRSSTWYKYQVKAFKLVNGKRVILSETPVLHAITSGSSRYANPVKVKVQKTKISVKAGKKKKIKASVVLPKNRICQNHCDEIRYIVEDTSIATVTKKGVIKAKKKGKTVVYAMAQNGVSKKITVTVK